MKEEIIQAIHHDEVEQFFKSIDLYSQLVSGDLKCTICGNIITKDNFRAIGKKSGEIIICCNNEGCYNQFIKEGVE